MKSFHYTEPFKKDYETLPREIKRALDKALKLLLENPSHPSLQTRKLPHTFIWYARLTRGYRLTFQVQENLIILRRVGTHKILDFERKN